MEIPCPTNDAVVTLPIPVDSSASSNVSLSITMKNLLDVMEEEANNLKSIDEVEVSSKSIAKTNLRLSVDTTGEDIQKYVGTIKVMNKTYGFIKVLNNGIPYDVFVHALNINTKGESSVVLKKRDVVSFCIKEEISGTEKKYVAYNVTLIQSGPANTPTTPPLSASNTPKKNKWAAYSNSSSTSSTPNNHRLGSNTAPHRLAHEKLDTDRYKSRTNNSTPYSKPSSSASSPYHSSSTSLTSSPSMSPSKALSPDAKEFKPKWASPTVIVSKGPSTTEKGWTKKA